MSSRMVLEVDLTNATPATLDAAMKLIGYIKGDPAIVALTQQECQTTPPPEPVATPAPAPAPEPEPEQGQASLLPDVVEYTLSDLRRMTSEKAQELDEAGVDGRTKVFPLIEKHGGGKQLAKIPAANHAAYVADLKALTVE